MVTNLQLLYFPGHFFNGTVPPGVIPSMTTDSWIQIFMQFGAVSAFLKTSLKNPKKTSYFWAIFNQRYNA